MTRLGIARDQRSRDYMEDRVVTGAAAGGLVVGVFDGHGGDIVADHAADSTLRLVEAALGRERRQDAMWRAVFTGLDFDIRGCGSTATLLFLDRQDLSVAWVGDSRALLVTKSGWRPLTRDHRIDQTDELERVVSAGAVIDPPYAMDPRTWHGLMMTRSLGDREMRRVGIVAEPETLTVQLDDAHVGFVAATDGLWDVVGNDEAAAVCRSHAPQPAAERLVAMVVERRGSDNVTVVVGRFAEDL